MNYNLSGVVVSSDVTAEVQLELFKNNVPVISGGWQCSIHYNGQKLRKISDWKERNSQTENDCELLEIESELDGGFRLRRFCLLDVANRIFVACDSILGDLSLEKDRGKRLRYESTFICSDNLKSSKSGKNVKSDIIFKPSPKVSNLNKPASFRVIPLASSVVEFLRASGGKIYLSQNCESSSMFVPIFFDFKLSRIDKKTIWRELTVGENLEQVPPDKATAYRIQTGKDQFLLYCSLIPSASRTFLGHNLIDEICYAKFDPKLGVTPLLTK
ncbi:MAG: hypothetical protein LBJ00_18360 [Planctomycetaceae bacterium]|nr:hypothetical protein [Planctomycetaceae bacterium]